jgi:hypothetical protein
MKTFRFLVRPDIRLSAGQLPSLTEEILVETLVGVAVREVGETQWGLHFADIQLRRPTVEEALNDSEKAFEQLGFALVEVAVSDWATETVGQALVGRLSGLVIGGGLSENLLIGAFAAAVGSAAGAFAGHEARTLKAEYLARRDFRGAWTFAEQAAPGPVSVLRPRFSGA